ncbi:DUF6873 family GME fold protein [Geosporobacter ferrireducens]|uniref:DUF6873 family GME fold protein n=1 Tax=Geosporobacter ferrireducens TaxID=1424294 RepID=UPI00139E3550|nr:hypothetical protein [Geosporobacter ferrireducens]MTI56481.1 hypothetical protein [Geosporobacter ferrireducens]
MTAKVSLNPFISKEKVSHVIVDGRISKETMNNFAEMGIHIVKTPCCRDLYPQIAGHPDILLHPVTKKDFVVAPNVFTYMERALGPLGYNVIPGEKVLSRNYPDNIAYNVARISNFALHHTKFTDPVLSNLLQEYEIPLIHIKQGYSKCAVCAITDQAVITADRGIAKAVEKLGVEVLLITPGYIVLPDMEYGFIGGSTGFVGNNKLAFYGSIYKHPDSRRITDFLAAYHIEPIFLGDEMLRDFGSIIPLN